MIKSLRTYHFSIWRVFALALPIAFTMALVLRPMSTQSTVGQNKFTFDLKRSKDESIIGVHLTNALQSPSCLIYALPKSGEKKLLGTIHRPGEHVFTYSGKIIGVQLFDLIRQKEIHTHYFDHDELP